jgi:hypothetical protein
MLADSCLTFAVSCGTLFKGVGVVVAGFALFIGSVYVLLSAVFGRWMGYLVLSVSFFGWMIVLSGIWWFGFWSQGPTTPTNLGPRGSDPSWQVLGAGLAPGSDRYSEFSSYPGDGWQLANPNDPSETANITSVTGAAGTYLANQANAELGIAPDALNAVTSTQFVVNDISFDTTADGTQLAVVHGAFVGGGPETTLSMYYWAHWWSVPRYSMMFFFGSILLFGIHLPLLDRAEKKRKEFLTGGTAPAWYGPA